MLKNLIRAALVAAAVVLIVARAQASGSIAYVAVGEEPLRTGHGECWRTGEWAPRLASAPCDELLLRYANEVLFEFDRADLGPQGRKLLDDLARKLAASELQSVRITGHADRIGGRAYNASLSERRAQAVHAVLLKRGLPESLVRYEGRGDSEPLTAGRCDAIGAESRETLIACLQPDRRVEIEVAGRLLLD